MAMQTDVKATAPLTSTGAFTTAGAVNITTRTRVKGIYAVCGASAGSVVITSGSETLFTMNTPTAANAGFVYMILPGEGILAENGLSGTVTNTTSTVLFYG